MFYSVAHYLGESLPFPVPDFYFGSIMVREHIQYDFSCFKFIEICFMANNVIYLGIYSMDTKKQ